MRAKAASHSHEFVALELRIFSFEDTTYCL